MFSLVASPGDLRPGHFLDQVLWPTMRQGAGRRISLTPDGVTEKPMIFSDVSLKSIGCFNETFSILDVHRN